jgi:hypothetical protein
MEAGALMGEAAVARSSDVPPLSAERLCHIDAHVGAIVSLGAAAYGERRVVAIDGGSVSGPGINGTILPGGADWQILRADGVLDIEAHYVLRLDDGALVEIMSQGYRYGPPEVIAAMARGEAVAPADYFFRTMIRFQTGAAAYAELNRTLAVARAARETEWVRLDVYKII